MHLEICGPADQGQQKNEFDQELYVLGFDQ